MLDEKGRLFGKINIVDLLIILVVIAAVAFVGIKYVMPSAQPAPEGQDIQMTVYVANTYRFVTDKLEKGASVWDSGGDEILGTVADWKLSSYYEYNINNDGETVTYEKPEICIAEITINCKGSVGEFGATIGDTLYGLGHTMVFYCGESKLYGSVEAIEVK